MLAKEIKYLAHYISDAFYEIKFLNFVFVALLMHSPGISVSIVTRLHACTVEVLNPTRARHFSIFPIVQNHSETHDASY